MRESDTRSNHVSDTFEQKKWMSHKTGSQPPVFACLTLPQLWLWHQPPNSQVRAFPHRLQPCLHLITLLLPQGLRPPPPNPAPWCNTGYTSELPEYISLPTCKTLTDRTAQASLQLHSTEYVDHPNPGEWRFRKTCDL